MTNELPIKHLLRLVIVLLFSLYSKNVRIHKIPPEGSRKPENNSTYFTKGHTDLSLEAIGPKGGVPYQYF